MDLWSVNGLTVSGALSLAIAALGLLRRSLRRSDSDPRSLSKRLARWASATGRVPLVEDALDYTTEYNHRLLEQREAVRAELTWYQREVDRLTQELSICRSEPHPPTSSPSAASAPGSSAGSIDSDGARVPRKPTGD